MRQPGSSQIIYVQVDADDTTEVYAAPAEKNVFVRVIDAFRSAFTDAINYFSWSLPQNFGRDGHFRHGPAARFISYTEHGR